MSRKKELELLKIRLGAFKTTLRSASEKTKSGHASTTIANEFNTIVDLIKEEAPELEKHLPAKVKSSTSFARMGVSDANYIDIEIYAEQLIQLIEHILNS